MANKVTFIASDSDQFKVFLVGAWNETPILEIPLNAEFDYTQYASAESWQQTTHRILVVPDEGVTLISAIPAPYDYSWDVFRQSGDNLVSYGLNRGKPDFVVTVVAQGGGVETVSPYNRVYKVNSDIIQDFSNIVARPPKSDINLSDYVVNLISIPFEIPDDFTGVVTPIVLGSVVTPVEAPIVTTDLMPISLGEIEVSGFAGNSLDYVAADYTLILPYLSEEITLEPQWVVGETISAQYVLDAYSGDITINVFSTAQADPIHTSKSSLGRVIPFKMYGDKIDSTTGAIQGAENGVLSAYIRVQRKVLTQGEFSNLVTLEAELGDLRGFVSVENIELVCAGTVDEKQEIIRQLKNGVYIK